MSSFLLKVSFHHWVLFDSKLWRLKLNWIKENGSTLIFSKILRTRLWYYLNIKENVEHVFFTPRYVTQGFQMVLTSPTDQTWNNQTDSKFSGGICLIIIMVLMSHQLFKVRGQIWPRSVFHKELWNFRQECFLQTLHESYSRNSTSVNFKLDAMKTFQIKL